MRMRTRTMVLVGAIIAAVALIFIWMQKPRPKNIAVVRIGAILPLTGNLGWFGEHARDAGQLLQEKLNGLEGPRLEIVYYDSKSTPKDGMNAYKKMVLDGIRWAYVSLDAVAKTIIPEIENDGVILFVGSVDNDITKLSQNVFRLYFGMLNQVEAQMEFMRSAGSKKTSIVMRDIPVYRKFLGEVMTARLKDLGIEVLNVHSYLPDTRDFRPIWTKVKAEAPDTIVISDFGNLYPVIYGQLKGMDVKARLIDGAGMLNVKNEDLPLYEGVVFAAPAYFGKDTSGFGSLYVQRFGRNPTYESYYFYDVVHSLYSSIANLAEPTADALRGYLLTNGFLGISQPRIQFNENRDLQVDVILKMVKDALIVDFVTSSD